MSSLQSSQYPGTAPPPLSTETFAVWLSGELALRPVRRASGMFGLAALAEPSASGVVCLFLHALRIVRSPRSRLRPAHPARKASAICRFPAELYLACPQH